MQKILFSCLILTAVFFVVYSQNDGNTTTLATTQETNKTISISSNSVKIVVKCRDKNSILTNIYLDNTGSVRMDNNDQIDQNTTDTPIFLVFNQCPTQTNNLLSLLKSFSPFTSKNNSQDDFSGIPIASSNFHISFNRQTFVQPTPENETIILA